MVAYAQGIIRCQHAILQRILQILKCHAPGSFSHTKRRENAGTIRRKFQCALLQDRYNYILANGKACTAVAGNILQSLEYGDGVIQTRTAQTAQNTDSIYGQRIP